MVNSPETREARLFSAPKSQLEMLVEDINVQTLVRRGHRAGRVGG